jgi:hypothetical protein
VLHVSVHKAENNRSIRTTSAKAFIALLWQGCSTSCKLLLSKHVKLTFNRTVGFVISFSTFLSGCIDYANIRKRHSLSEALVDRCVSRFHPFTLFLVLSFAGFYAWRIVRFGRAVKQLWNMHEFFEELLGIPEVREGILRKHALNLEQSDIQTVPWHVIVSRLTALKSEHPATQQAVNDPASSNHPSVCHSLHLRLL